MKKEIQTKLLAHYIQNKGTNNNREQVIEHGLCNSIYMSEKVRFNLYLQQNGNDPVTTLRKYVKIYIRTNKECYYSPL